MEAVDPQGDHRLAAGVRGSRFPERHHRQGCAENDPDWSLEDIRHTSIRWLPSTTENAVGPHVSDPRTGEILNGSVRMFQNVLNLQRDWYFTQAAQLDPRARSWPMPDSLMGRLLEFVVAHEIGHTIGLAARPDRQLHLSGRQRAQRDVGPQDGAQPEHHGLLALQLRGAAGGQHPARGHRSAHRAVRQVGHHAGAISPIPGAKTPAEELPTLDKWARMQDTIPWYRFSANNEFGAYGTLNEAVGDADPVKSTGLGFKNIARVMNYIPGAAIRAGRGQLRSRGDLQPHRRAVGHRSRSMSRR